MSDNNVTVIMGIKGRKVNVTLSFILVPQGKYFSKSNSKTHKKNSLFSKCQNRGFSLFFHQDTYFLVRKTNHASICNRFESSFHLMPASKHASYSYKLKLLYHAEIQHLLVPLTFLDKILLLFVLAATVLAAVGITGTVTDTGTGTVTGTVWSPLGPGLGP